MTIEYKQQIADHASQSERNAWNRKRRQVEAIVERLDVQEQQLLDMRARMQPSYDTIAELRQSMINECIHPIDLIVEHDGLFVCKFCDRKFATPVIEIASAIEPSTDQPIVAVEPEEIEQPVAQPTSKTKKLTKAVITAEVESPVVDQVVAEVATE